MRQHLVARVGAPWHRPWLADGAQAVPGPGASPTLTDVVCPGRGWGRGELLGNPRGRGRIAAFPHGLPWGTPASKLPSLMPCPPKDPPAHPPYPLGAPAELVLCVPQSHRILIDIIGHSHHLEHRTPHPG